MRTSKYLLATERETPNDAELISHKLMLRAGMIRKLASGIYSWLPTGIRVLRKVENIIREEMNKVGAIETLMPNLTPAKLWQETGRWQKYGPELLRITDRHGRDFCFGPTHEEAFTAITRHELNSYKQLPMTLYQIQTKFRDEIRPRYGVMRGREFLMKDAYSFHADKNSLKNTYKEIYQAYCNIFDRLGVKYRAVIADPGSIGGNITHEFHVLADAGEDDLFYSDQGDYAANVERATSLAPSDLKPEAQDELQTINTPNSKTIKDLCDNFNFAITTTVKTLVIQDADNNFFALILRGDHELNEIKANSLPQIKAPFKFAAEADIAKLFNANIGSLGPVNCPIPVIADKDAVAVDSFVCGANINDKHLTCANFERDVTNYTVADLRNVVVGDKSPDGNGTLQHTKGIEVGHIFQLEDHYSSKMHATILNESGKAVTMQMGCYGLGVTRTIAAAIEQNHDDNGIIWPAEMAPFDIAIIPMKYCQSAQVKEAADKVYFDLIQAGYDVLLDDRKERPGVMFAEMDLLGIPKQIIIGERGLKNNLIEYKERATREKQEISLDNFAKFFNI